MSPLKLPRLESRALRYGYSNARVRAMKGLLLKSAALDEMIRVGTIEGMVELLQKTGYKNDLSEASAMYRGSTLIENAAARNFSRNVRKLLRLTPQGDRVAVQALLIRWDLMNLKTLMHAKRAKKTYEEVRPYLVEVGGLTDDDFKRIMKAESGVLMRELRRTELGQKMLSMGTGQLNRQMKDAFTSALRSLDTFMQMETVIDAYTYMFMEHALAEVGGREIGSIRHTLKKEIDAKNIMIIERLKKHNVPRDKIMGSLIQGGTLGSALLLKVAEAKDLQAVITLVKPKFSALELRGEGKVLLTDMEIALEKSLAAQKAVAFQQSMLSVGVMIGFLLLKEEETNNLRKIAKGKEFNIPEAEVRGMLVIV
ncbi:MAG: V-type ATPase subunit [Candidatus Micrarchaeota archaeon]